MNESANGLITALMLARFVWILWTGSASALQSSEYGNVGPIGSWTKLGSADDRTGCWTQQKTALEEFLKGHPEAVRRKTSLVYEKKKQPGDEDMVVHTVTRFICLPDNVDPAKGQQNKPQE